jgi:hypothetical protein
MKLILKRIAKRKNYTIGKLYLCNESKPPLTGGGLEGAYLCDTLEPPCIEMKVDRTVEEVLNDKETTKPTFHKKIKIAQVRQYDYNNVSKQIDKLVETSYHYDDMETVRIMKQIVPEYKSKNSVYESLD